MHSLLVGENQMTVNQQTMRAFVSHAINSGEYGRDHVIVKNVRKGKGDTFTVTFVKPSKDKAKSVNDPKDPSTWDPELIDAFNEWNQEETK